MWERKPYPSDPCAKCGKVDGTRVRRLCHRCYYDEREAGRLSAWGRMVGTLRCSQCGGARGKSEKYPDTTMCHKCRRNPNHHIKSVHVPISIGPEYPDWLALWPTKARGQSSAKIKVLTARAERRLPLFHPGDLYTRDIARRFLRQWVT